MAQLRLSTGTLDLDRGVLFASDGERWLTNIESRVLRYLVRQGRAVPQQELLVEVWGYAPTVRSRTVRTTVGRLRAKIEVDPRSPAHLVTEPSQGYRLVALPSQPHPTTSDLIGRDAVLDRLDQVFATGFRLASLLGPLGVGRTAVARAWAHRTDGAVYVDAEGATNRHELAQATARSLGAVLKGDPWASLLALQPRSILVLDHVDAVFDEVRALSDAWPVGRMLVCGPAPFVSVSEQVVELPPLTGAPLETLFHRRWTAALLDATPPDPDVVSDILRKIDGLPLLVELAAGWASTLTPEDLAHRLEEPGWLLSPTLETAIDAALDELSAPDRDLLEQLTVFRGFRPEDAEAVLGADLTALRRLRRRSWIQRNPHGKFSLLGVVRSRLEAHPVGDLEPIRAHHAAHFAGLAESLDPAGPDQHAELERLDALRSNLLSAHGWAAAADPDLCARLTVALEPLLSLQGQLPALSTLLAAAPDDHPGVLEARARRARQTQDATTALTLARAAVAAGGGAAAELELALAHVYVGNLPAARSAFRAALDEDSRVSAAAWMGLASLERQDGHWDEAEAMLERALALARPDGSPSKIAEICMELALVQRFAGRLQDALATLDLAPEPTPTVGVWLDVRRGTTLMHGGSFEEALVVFDRVADRARRLGMARAAAWSAARRLNIEVEMGLPEATETLREVTELARGQDALLEMELTVRRGQLRLEGDAFSSAQTEFAHLADLTRAAGKWDRCYVDFVQGLGWLFGGDSARGAAAMREARAIAEQVDRKDVRDASRACLALVEASHVGAPAALPWIDAIQRLAACRRDGDPVPEEVRSAAELNFAVRMALRAHEAGRLDP